MYGECLSEPVNVRHDLNGFRVKVESPAPPRQGCRCSPRSSPCFLLAEGAIWWGRRPAGGYHLRRTRNDLKGRQRETASCWRDAGLLLIFRCPSGRSLRCRFLCSIVALRLDGMRVNDCPNQPGEALVDLRATGGIVHLHAAALATDQTRLSQCPEVLRERGLRNRLVADCQKRRAVLRALLPHDIGIDGHPYGVGQSVENSFHRNVLNRWVEQRPHTNKSSHRGQKVQ